jgi:hypothetical protein
MDTAVDEARLKSEEEAMQDATSDVYGSDFEIKSFSI